MSMSARSNNYGRAIVAAFVSIGFLWTLALSASPQLHQRVHPDANRAEHSCAATMIASGSYDHAAHPPLVSASVPAIQFSEIPALIAGRTLRHVGRKRKPLKDAEIKLFEAGSSGVLQTTRSERMVHSI